MEQTGAVMLGESRHLSYQEPRSFASLRMTKEAQSQGGSSTPSAAADIPAPERLGTGRGADMRGTLVVTLIIVIFSSYA